MKIRGALFLSAIAAFHLSGPARATTLVDTGTPPEVGNGVLLAARQSVAAEFSLSAGTTIGAVQGYFAGNVSQNITIEIFTDGGDIPGPSLYSGTFASTIGDGSWQGLGGLDWALDAGTYWVAFEGDSPGTPFSGYIPRGAPNPLGNEVVRTPTGYINADSINVGVRIFDTASAVPEPAVWMMMMAGFALAGGAMRRRATAIRFA